MFFRRKQVARRTTEHETSAAVRLLEELSCAAEGALTLEDRVTALARLREAGLETPAGIDRFLLARIVSLREVVSTVQEEHGNLRGLIENMTTPPYIPAIYLAETSTPVMRGVLVQTENDRRVVQLGEGLSFGQLVPGDEVFLNSERNFLVAKAEASSFLSGEVATYNRSMPDGRMVLRSRDEELVVLARAALRSTPLKAGDSVRFSRSGGLAFEKVEHSGGEEFFIESTPKDSFNDIGGLDREIEEIKRVLTLHILHPRTAGKYRLPRKKAITIEGPPGNGKTKFARATCRWLGELSRGGRSKFLNVKPGGLNSMWFGQTEAHYREIFRVAREAAEVEPRVPVVMFFDEIDSIGGHRSDSASRVDPSGRILTAFMAELSGLEERGNIVVLAATNRIGSIDPALLRPGRLGDLVLQFKRPGMKAARAILACHLPADIPYACNGEDQASVRDALLDLTVAQLFAQTSDTELATLTFRDGKKKVVRAADLISGAQLESIAQSALERACVRETEGGPPGLRAGDLNAAICDYFLSAPRSLTPRNAHNYLSDIPQDVDVVRVDIADRRVTHPHRYRVEAA
jgi:proteasome-associated ATPase